MESRNSPAAKNQEAGTVVETATKMTVPLVVKKPLSFVIHHSSPTNKLVHPLRLLLQQGARHKIPHRRTLQAYSRSPILAPAWRWRFRTSRPVLTKANITRPYPFNFSPTTTRRWLHILLWAERTRTFLFVSNYTSLIACDFDDLDHH